jgi:SAM-dependent methyltransferase
VDEELGIPAGEHEVDVDRRYFVDYVARIASAGALVLDFGCGSGTLVRMLRAEGYDAFGVDIRWPGADYGDLEADELGRRGVLRYFEEGGRLPFEDDMFDVLVSDQVFEHVVPFRESVDEIERVVKPDGVMYHHFPARRVLREGHIGIPLAHRLPSGKVRLYYTALLRRLGLGIYKDERPAIEWAAEKLDWVDRWTIYRPASEIHRVMGRNAVLRHREIDYCRFRAGNRRWLRILLDRDLLVRPAEQLFRLLAFDAIETRFRSSTS